MTPSINESLQKLQQLSDTILELTPNGECITAFSATGRDQCILKVSVRDRKALLQTALFTYWFEDGVSWKYCIVSEQGRALRAEQSLQEWLWKAVQQMEQRQQTIRVRAHSPRTQSSLIIQRASDCSTSPAMAAVEAV